MKKVLLLVWFLCLAVSLWAQEPIRFGKQAVYLEANVQPKTRSGYPTSSLELGIPAGDRLNVLVQFSGDVRPENLEKRGIKLQNYLGSNAYFATVDPGVRASDFVGTGLRAVTPIKGDWKLAEEVLGEHIPEYAVDGTSVALSLFWFPTVDWNWVKNYLSEHHIPFSSGSDLFHNVQISIPKDEIQKLAEEEWVQSISLKDAPKTLANFRGARMHGAATLRRPYAEGGLALTGKGVRIGIWDGNVAPHVDYGDRYHCLEFETSLSSTGAHGMHVTGTMIGAGLLDPRGRGMAPEAEIWTNNFNVSSNGKVVALEMFEVWDEHKISLTNNSYGLSYARSCESYKDLSYSTFSTEPAIDLLCAEVPSLTHVFAAGNEGGYCRSVNPDGYGTITHRAKNPIYVGNISHLGEIEISSSRGPADDGRLFPTVSARGLSVWSTVDEQGYEGMTGTSMACPTVTGHLALVTERYKQLHGGVVPNNTLLKALIANTARDEGRPGPDYDYGFGSIETQNAILAMENGWYKEDKIRFNDVSKTYDVTIPNGVKRFRAMIVWNDPVAIKQYAYGESALINDLDLSVEVAGETILAYALDKKDPKAPAQKKGNHIDPIEQVEIVSPAAGTYKLNVTAKIRQGGEQPFTITWYFDKEKPEMISPLPGETYRPGEYILMNVKNMDGRLKVELSYDGGESYISLGEKTKRALVTIPNDAPITNNALLRVTDASSNVLIMQRPFMIMPQVEDVKLIENGCSNEGWLLSWKSIEGVKSYNVLKADIRKGEYEIVANVAQNLYEIPASVIDPTYTIFAVAGVDEQGLMGTRSLGVLAKSVLANVLTEEQLPFEETFVGYPLKNVQLDLGKSLTIGRRETPVSAGLPLGSMLLTIQGRKGAKDWSKPFEVRNNVASFKFCSLDLTAIDPSRKLFFTVYGLLMHDKVNTASQLRLVVNDEVVENVVGQQTYLSDNGDHRYAWDISKFAGKKVSLRLETALERVSNDFTIVSYEIAHLKEERDIYVNPIQLVESKANLGVETFSFNISNNSSSEIEKLPVSVIIDGKLAYSTVIEKLQPFADKFIDVSYDFSTTQLEGKKFRVEIHAELDGDVVPSDNVKGFEVYNKGNVLLMPHSTKERSVYGITFPVEERLTYDVEESIHFYDYGGGLENYPAKEYASILFRPAEAARVVQVAFEEYDFANGDSLSIWTNVSDLSDLALNRPTHVLKGRGSACVMSSVGTGTVALRMQKQRGAKTRSGWKAIVSQVQLPDLWSLSNVEFVSLNKAPEKEITVDTLSLKVQVNGMQEGATLYGVPLTLEVDGQPRYLKIPKLNPKQNNIALNLDTFFFKRPYYKKIRATLGYDGYLNNNSKTFDRNRDVGAIKGTVKRPSNMYIDSMRVTGEKRVQTFYTSQLFYRLNTQVRLYLKSPNLLNCHLDYREKVNEEDDPLLSLDQLFPARLRVWLDLKSKPGSIFEDEEPEYYDVVVNKLTPKPLKADGTAKTAEELYLESRPSEIQIPIDLTKYQDLKADTVRMRIAFFTDDNWRTFKSGREVIWGQAFDCTAILLDKENPLAADLQVVSMSGPETGVDLGERPITVKVRNNGLRPVESFNLAALLNNELFTEEEFRVAIPAFGAEKEVTFAKKVDMSKPGAYRFDIRVKDKDSVPSNDQITERYYHYPKATDNLYYTHWIGSDKEWFQIPELNKGGMNESITIEGWWRLDGSQNSTFINSEGFKVRALNKSSLGVDNGLYLQFPQGTVFRTTEAVLKPGQWQHIAIAVQRDYLSMLTGEAMKVKLYVDGKEMPLEGGGQGDYKFSYMIFNQSFKGEMGMLRFWHGARKRESIVADMFRSVRAVDGTLPKECKIEYSFSEGFSNCVSSNQQWPAQLNTKRLESTADDCVWRSLTQIVSAVTSPLAVAESSWEQDVIKLKVLATTDWSKVNLSFVAAWPGTQVMLEGTSKPLTSIDILDFSNSEHKLAFVAKRDDLFGKNIEQKFSVQLESDKSAECILERISLLAANNKGLKNDIVFNNPKQTIVFSPESADGKTFNAKKAKFTLEGISENAVLQYKDKGSDKNKKVAKGEIFEIDLSTPQVVTVLAENGRDSHSYVLKLSLNQTIEWKEKKLSLRYKKTPTQLKAKASSGLPCSYYTTDESVAVVNTNGELVTVGAGTTTVVAMQLGDALYQPAEEVACVVEVSRVPLTIAMKPVRIYQGDELPDWEFDYKGLVYPSQGQIFEIPYQVKLHNGSLWDESSVLAPGKYEVWPKGYVAPYDTLGYVVTRLPGELKVLRDERVFTLTVKVVDEQGAPLSAARVECGKDSYMTDQAGEVKISILRAGLYNIRISKENYSTEFKKNLRVTESNSLEVKLTSLSIELTYVAGDNGLIQGRAKQFVAKGGSGTTVVALPNPGFQFEKWNDGNTEAVRLDTEVSESKTITASFIPAKYTISYFIEPGGDLESGVLKQENIQFGAAGTPVKVKAKKGYFFLGWSDGVATLERTENNVHKNMNLTARFLPIYPLTYSQNFDGDDAEIKLWEMPENDDSKRWTKIARTNFVASEKSAKGYILGLQNGLGMKNYIDLVSPRLSLEDLQANAKVELRFTLLQSKLSEKDSDGKNGISTLVEYAINDGEWTLLKNLDGVDAQKSFEVCEVPAAELATAKSIRFRWRYKSERTQKADKVGIDDVSVSYSAALPPTQTVGLEYLATNHGFVKIAGDERSYSEIFTTTLKNTDGAAITAVPKSGYTFSKWSDGKTMNPRQDKDAIRVTAQFTKIEVEKAKGLYTAEEEGYIEGLTIQNIEIGARTYVVVARGNEGFTFAKWEDGVMTPARSDIMVAGGFKHTASFVKEFVLRYQVEGRRGGTIEGGLLEQHIPEGMDGDSVVAVPAPHYHFVKWSDGVTTPERRDLKVSENKTIKAIFTPDTYTVTVVTDGQGKVIIKELTTTVKIVNGKEVEETVEREMSEEELKACPYGTKILVLVPEQKPWKVTSIMALSNRNRQDISAAREYIVRSDVSIVATLERPEDKFIVTLNAVGEGTIEIEQYTEDMLYEVDKDTQLRVKATPKNTDYVLKSLMVDDKDILATKVFTVTKDVTVTAVFEESTAVEDPIFAQVMVAPNPFETQLVVKATNGDLRAYDLLDVTGKLVRSGAITANEEVIETGELKSGVYMLRLTAQNGAKKTFKVVKY